jgi:hypothetical protein
MKKSHNAIGTFPKQRLQLHTPAACADFGTVGIDLKAKV